MGIVFIAIRESIPAYSHVFVNIVLIVLIVWMLNSLKIHPKTPPYIHTEKKIFLGLVVLKRKFLLTTAYILLISQHFSIQSISENVQRKILNICFMEIFYYFRDLTQFLPLRFKGNPFNSIM